jgi:peptide/nickel transport system ATP-binding protein
MQSDQREVLLRIRELSVIYPTKIGDVKAVNGVSLDLHAGKVLGLVGEDGSGKTSLALAIMRGLPEGTRIGGSVRFHDQDLLALSEKEMLAIRGARIAVVLDDPLTSLNPAFSVGEQIAEAVRIHTHASKKEAWKQAVEWLKKVGIPAAEGRAADYPRSFSGGMRQRVVVAMALAVKPEIVIADEPTTALDVTIQAQVLALMRELCGETGSSLILITNNLGVAVEFSDRTAVMYGGQIVEESDSETLARHPRHPYTQGLFACAPDMNLGKARLAVIPGKPSSPIALPAGCTFHPRCRFVMTRCSAEAPQAYLVGLQHHCRCFLYDDHDAQSHNLHNWTGSQVGLNAAHVDALSHTRRTLLEVRNLFRYFHSGAGFLSSPGTVRAVDGISFSIGVGETLGLVGESGSGKTTVGRLVARLITPTRGTILLEGNDVTQWSDSQLRNHFRSKVQMIFQDPLGSLNPRLRVAEIIAEPLKALEELPPVAVSERVAAVMGRVGLDIRLIEKYPHELSGAERQRVGIAAALILDPKLIIADEPISTLDVSAQAQILNVMMDLRDKLGLSYLFISHDLNAVRHISNRVAVMYLGKIVEIAKTETLFLKPEHPYTQALLSAVPTPNPDLRRRLVILQGEIPSPLQPPQGCRFHTRCPVATPLCTRVEPVLEEIDKGHFVSCHFSPARTPQYLSPDELREMELYRTPDWEEHARMLRQAH